MPLEPISFAAHLVSPITPFLLALYAEPLAAPSTPARDATLTIAPPSFIDRSSARWQCLQNRLTARFRNSYEKYRQHQAGEIDTENEFPVVLTNFVRCLDCKVFSRNSSDIRSPINSSEM